MTDETLNYSEPFEDDESDEEYDSAGPERFSEAVVSATDWTTETIISQLERGNISLTPRFQRRDAWSRVRKSQFIESLILGLPIPQIVLAEQGRGKFIVLDGKQRLLSLLQFWGLGNGDKNRYSLAGLAVRRELQGQRLDDLKTNPMFRDDYDALLNQTIRTVVIKNWPNYDFLHLVFLRLNTGSVKLSPQELRQAILPGDFTDYVDDAALRSVALRTLLKLREPDYRMRDVELLARFLAFRFFLPEYGGRMKSFLDETFARLNGDWEVVEGRVGQAIENFESAVNALLSIFGDKVARKPGANPFNRAIFDTLVFYASDPQICGAMLQHPEKVRHEYTAMFSDSDFRAAVERDTAGVPNTALRLQQWGNALQDALSLDFAVPYQAAENQRITFRGLWNV